MSMDCDDLMTRTPDDQMASSRTVWMTSWPVPRMTRC